MTRGPTPDPSDHARHEPFLIARAVADDLAAPERDAAETLIERCPRCRALAEDLRSLSTSLATDLPAPRRHRDFRLSAEQARAARGSVFERAAAFLAGPRLALLQPLGAAAVSIGIAVAVLGTLTPTPFGGGTTGAEGAGGAAAPGAAQEAIEPPPAFGASPAARPAAGGPGAAEASPMDRQAVEATGAAEGEGGTDTEGGGASSPAAGATPGATAMGAVPPSPAATEGRQPAGPGSPMPPATEGDALAGAERDRGTGSAAPVPGRTEPIGPEATATSAAPVLIGSLLVLFGALLLLIRWLAGRRGADPLLR